MNIEKLTPKQYEIISEICRALSYHGASVDYLAIIGSWGDTLEEDDILHQLKQLNNNNH